MQPPADNLRGNDQSRPGVPVPLVADKGCRMSENHALRGPNAVPLPSLQCAASDFVKSAATTSCMSTPADVSIRGLPMMLAFDRSPHFHVPARFHVDAVGESVPAPDVDLNGSAAMGTIAHPT